ncbi:hypothetical protein BT69DRAFT_1277883 [Atractiella rhizophila]|nr:hypothetical protein BT69DRAFT_1277883 [Atractiella rhizophila]
MNKAREASEGKENDEVKRSHVFWDEETLYAIRALITMNACSFVFTATGEAVNAGIFILTVAT